MSVPTTTRPCLRCLGAGRVSAGDGATLGQARAGAVAVTCPECKGSGQTQVRR